ncbi:calcium-binding protein [Delftia acidovorans]|nr:calcium-binding protein [Delftia acidovorans]
MNSSSSLAAELMAQLQGAPMQQMADQIGASPAQTESAVGAALPVLLASLGRNAADPQGAANHLGALQRDHGVASGGAGGLDLGGLLGSLLGGGAGAGSNAGGGLDGAAILGHILGGNQQRAQGRTGPGHGPGQRSAPELLQLLAPIVMSFLAQRVSAGGMDAGGLGQVLGREHAQAQQQGGLGGGLLGSLLDQDGDGQVGLSDLMKIGGSLLGGRR